MNTVATRIGIGQRGETPFVRRARNNVAAHALIRQTRLIDIRQRRRRGVLWVVLAALVVFSAWDKASRLDEEVYTATFPSRVLESHHAAMR